jgi:dTMP kinase
MTARFVTLEGGEGVGKSTQLKRLAEALRGRGLDVVETREPGGSPGAELIRALLLQGEVERWSAEAEALLFAAARSDHVARTIRPALERGQWVLCDRFLDSSIAYQGLVGDVGADAVRRLHAIGSGGFLPNRTLLFRMKHDAAAARTEVRDIAGADRFGAREGAYHAEIGAAFDRLAAEDPARFRIVDAAGTPEAVTERSLSALEDML